MLFFADTARWLFWVHRVTNRTLSLSSNRLTGSFADGFRSLTGLINLNLGSNGLIGSFPGCIPMMTSLTYVPPCVSFPESRRKMTSRAVHLLLQLPVTGEQLFQRQHPSNSG